jgi:hypothetical protein
MSDKIKVAWFGSSHVQGGYDTYADEYDDSNPFHTSPPGYFQKLFDESDVVNYGHGGTGIDYMQFILPDVLKNNRPDIVYAEMSTLFRTSLYYSMDKYASAVLDGTWYNYSTRRGLHNPVVQSQYHSTYGDGFDSLTSAMVKKGTEESYKKYVKQMTKVNRVDSIVPRKVFFANSIGRDSVDYISDLVIYFKRIIQMTEYLEQHDIPVYWFPWSNKDFLFLKRNKQAWNIKKKCDDQIKIVDGLQNQSYFQYLKIKYQKDVHDSFTVDRAHVQHKFNKEAVDTFFAPHFKKLLKITY